MIIYLFRYQTYAALMGRAPNGFGQGPGLSGYQRGKNGGQETVLLSRPQMESHKNLVDSNNIMPFQVVNYCMATQGKYRQRNLDCSGLDVIRD